MRERTYGQLVDLARSMKELLATQEFQAYLGLLKEQVEDIHSDVRNRVSAYITSGANVDIGNIHSYYNGLELGFLGAAQLIDNLLRQEARITEDRLKQIEKEKKEKIRQSRARTPRREGEKPA